MASNKYKNVYINDYFTVGGPLEKSGNLKKFNITLDDFYYGEKTFELAEVKMQKVAMDGIIKKNKLKESDINLVIGGELSNQITTSTYNIKDYNIPFLGVYSACACYTESLLILASMIDKNEVLNGLVITSSHNLTSEKQFRFPVEYGAPKPDYTTFTATGSVCNYLSNTKSNIKIDSSTIGRVIDMGICDASNLGAVMAPAAADTLNRHLLDTKRNINYYDIVLTGDLGEVGSIIFKEFLEKNYQLKINNHLDAACQIYKKEQKDKTKSGASGPVALPLTLWNKIIHEKKYKKILLIGTGALHSPTMCNQKQSIPSIAHAVSLEVE